MKKEKELGFLFFPFSRHRRLKSTFLPFFSSSFRFAEVVDDEMTKNSRTTIQYDKRERSGGRTREFFIIAVIKLNEKSELSIFFTKIFLTLHIQESGMKKIHFDLFCAFFPFENHDELRSCSNAHTIC